MKYVWSVVMGGWKLGASFPRDKLEGSADMAKWVDYLPCIQEAHHVYVTMT